MPSSGGIKQGFMVLGGDHSKKSEKGDSNKYRVKGIGGPFVRDQRLGWMDVKETEND